MKSVFASGDSLPAAAGVAGVTAAEFQYCVCSIKTNFFIDPRDITHEILTTFPRGGWNIWNFSLVLFQRYESLSRFISSKVTISHFVLKI